MVKLPVEGGDVTDFFVRLGHTPEEFLRLLEEAQPLPGPNRAEHVRVQRFRSVADSEIERLKSSVSARNGVYFSTIRR